MPIERDVVDERTPEERLLREESQERVAVALQALPARARDILLLKFREGLSGPQIASALGLSLGAAWQQMSRALRLLKLRLAEKP